VSRRLAAIVDPYTSGTYLAASLRRAGYECVAVQSQPDVPEVFRSSFHPEDFERVLAHAGDVAQTSERLARAGAACVIAGCELGVELADELAWALDLPSNGAELRHARRDKGLMADAFRDAGLQAPRQLCSERVEPLLDWIRREATTPWVVKPANSSSSDGVQLCATEADVERAFASIIGHRNVLGLENRRVMVQEYSSGSEYVVDTVSCGGRHELVAFWKYSKPPSTASFMGYDGMELLPARGEIQQRLFEAACGGLDALQIRNGPGHSELFWGESGPLLLEIGARMHGGENPLLAARCGARSQVEQTVRAYTDPTQLAADRADGYELTHHCTLAFLMPQRCGRLRARPRVDRIEALEAFHELEIADCLGEPVPPVIGWVALVHPDKQAVDDSLAALRRLEADDFYPIDPL
jgi:biotin carboxylase